MREKMENGDLWQRSTLYLSGSSQNLLCGSTLAGTVCLPGASSCRVPGLSHSWPWDSSSPNKWSNEAPARQGPGQWLKGQQTRECNDVTFASNCLWTVTVPWVFSYSWCISRGIGPCSKAPSLHDPRLETSSGLCVLLHFGLLQGPEWVTWGLQPGLGRRVHLI